MNQDNSIETTWKLKLNPKLIIREESDDWSILYHLEDGDCFGLNPVSSRICSHLTGEFTIRQILDNVLAECINAPKEAPAEMLSFIQDLWNKGYVAIQP